MAAKIAHALRMRFDCNDAKIYEASKLRLLEANDEIRRTPADLAAARQRCSTQ